MVKKNCLELVAAASISVWCGLPHAHMVFHLGNAPDIDANNCDKLLAFVNKNFIAELPRFAGNEYQNIHWWGNEIDLTKDFKVKALDMV